MKKRQAIQRIGLLSLCHMGIDFLCAFSLYHHFSDRYETFLLYNYCAFALQLPLGILIDIWSQRKDKALLPGIVFTGIGILLTVLGSYVSHIILGIGNAFFHVGGGVLTIHDDDDCGFDGRGLGTFVAPGAIGLILGTLYHGTAFFEWIRILVSASMILIAVFLYRNKKERSLTQNGKVFDPDDSDLLFLILACFAVVILRSLTGMAISFTWKTSNAIVILSVIALACGKTAGGFLSARFGMKKTVIVTLSLSAVAYLFGNVMSAGLAALFLFNMTMPLTLYLLVRNMRDMPGFAFGILTFGLFLGYLPVYYSLMKGMDPFPFGTISSLISLVILYASVSRSEKRNGNG